MKLNVSTISVTRQSEANILAEELQELGCFAQAHNFSSKSLVRLHIPVSWSKDLVFGTDGSFPVAGDGSERLHR